jgi:hypothetical protein
MKKLLKVLPVIFCVAVLAGCDKTNVSSDKAQPQGQAATVSVNVSGGDLSKMTQPCTVDGAKVAGLNAGQSKAKKSDDYAKDNKCTSDEKILNSTYNQYYQNGQQLKGLGVKIGS